MISHKNSYQMVCGCWLISNPDLTLVYVVLRLTVGDLGSRLGVDVKNRSVRGWRAGILSKEYYFPGNSLYCKLVPAPPWGCDTDQRLSMKISINPCLPQSLLIPWPFVVPADWVVAGARVHLAFPANTNCLVKVVFTTLGLDSLRNRRFHDVCRSCEK